MVDEVANITNNYLTARPGISFSQMKADGLYPNAEAPVADLVGTSSFRLEASAGIIWFTDDGSDPMDSPGAQIYDTSTAAVPIIDLASEWRYLDNASEFSTSA